MKKKQKEKLMKAFRPSFENARQQLFQHLENKADELYDLAISVKLNPKKQDELLIENQGPTTRDKQLTVPIDQSFTTIIKRIQEREKGLLDQFATNLTHEIANYWYVPAVKAPETESAVATTKTVAEAKTTNEAAKTTATPAVEKADEQTAVAASTETAATDSMSLAAFTAAIQQFPKFFVDQDTEAILVKEKTPKEDRLLATISRLTVGEFVIEKALDRKYKLKTEVIPVIETLANTPLAER